MKVRYLVLLALFIIIILGLNQANHFWWQNPDKDADAKTFEIEYGETLSDIAKRLEEDELVAGDKWFRLAAEIEGVADEVQEGSFELKPGEDYRTILETLTAQVLSEAGVRVTVPEGYTLDQMGKLMVDKGLTTEAEWSEAVGVDSPLEAHEFVVAAQKPDSVDLEGYLFPDTYEFTTEMGAEQIATIMLENLAGKVEDIGVPTGDASGMTTHEVITLASIVEREVRQPDTMKNVADIFLKRLEIGMALQADSTVNYVTGGDSPSITIEERDNTDSPYNTYKYPGLPPGPISAPGLNAIQAVLNPTHNDYYYFLTTDEGEIYYAETNEEHAANKAKYLK